MEINDIFSFSFHFGKHEKGTCVNSSRMFFLNFRLSVKFSSHLINSTRKKNRIQLYQLLQVSICATTIHKIFKRNSSFHVKQRTTGKVQFLFFSCFLLGVTKFSFWEEDWALGYSSMKF